MKKALLCLSVFALLLLFAAQPATLVAQDATPEPTAEATAAATEEAAITLPEVTPALLTGSLFIDGSSTVGPVASAMLEMFMNDGFSGTFSLGTSGTGAGFKAFCEEMTSVIATASRPIKSSGDPAKPDELEKCRANGREPIAFRFGTDGVALVVNKSNTFATNLTSAEVTLLLSTAVYWDDVRAGFPHERIVRYFPGNESGTLDFVAEAFFAKDKAPMQNASGLNQSEDDNVIVGGVAGNTYAIGFFGFAYYAENSARLNLLSIDGVQPTFDTVEAGTYRLSRPLFLYTTAAIMQAQPQVAGFVNYFLTHVGEVIQDVGYFPASVGALNESKRLWLTATNS